MTSARRPLPDVPDIGLQVEDAEDAKGELRMAYLLFYNVWPCLSLFVFLPGEFSTHMLVRSLAWVLVGLAHYFICCRSYSINQVVKTCIRRSGVFSVVMRLYYLVD